MTKTITAEPAQEEAASQDGHIDWLEPQDETQMRQFILQADDRPEELVPVPLWRVKVLVRAMSGTQRALYEALPRDQKSNRFKDLKHAYFEVARMCCVHPRTHKPILQVADEREMMDEKNGAIIDMLVGKALRLSELMPNQAEQARKNLQNTLGSSITTDSQSDSATEGE